MPEISKLEYAICNNNQLQSVDLHQQINLEWLNLSNNQFTEIPFPKLINNLSVFDFEMNNLDCNDWPTVHELDQAMNAYSRINRAQPLFRYSPQNGLDPYNCN